MPAKNLRRVAEGGTYCHVYNRGIESRNIFADDVDYKVFLGYLEDYLSAPKSLESAKQEFTVNGKVYKGVPHQPKNYLGKVELISYSLKPDHFHLLVHQKADKSLQAFIRSLCTRYSIYFNKKYNRSGSLFAGPYKSVHLKDDSSLILLTKYFHKEGGYSTYLDYAGQKETPWVRTKFVLSDAKKEENTEGDADGTEDYKTSPEEQKQLSEIALESIQKPLERRDLKVVAIKPWARVPELLAASAVFLLLLGFSFRNVTAQTNGPLFPTSILGIKTASNSAPALSPSPSPSPIPSPVPTPTPAAEYGPSIILKVTSPAKAVDVKMKPTQNSEIIAAVKDGDALEMVRQDGDWFEIKLPSGSRGFVPSKFVQLPGGAKKP